MKKTVRLIPLILAVLLLFTACTATEYPEIPPELQVAIEKADEIWVCGKTVSLPIKVTEFPLAFPELYRNIEFDPNDYTQRARDKKIDGQSGDLYFTARVAPFGNDLYKRIPYTQAMIYTFAMYGGSSGHMDVWGVTFDQTKEEAEAAIAEYFNFAEVFEDLERPTAHTAHKPDLSPSVLSALRVSSSTDVVPLLYMFDRVWLNVYYVDNTVRGLEVLITMFG